MKKIKIKFVDFWQNFDYKNFILYERLSKYYDVIVCDNPDYIVYSCFGYENANYRNCIKIYFTGENVCPDFNLCDYAISFERLDYGDRHFRLPIYYNRGDLLEGCKNKHKNIDKDILDSKTNFCSFVYSNKYADKKREDLFNLICSYKNVDSAGKYLNNMPNNERTDDIIKFQESYKFSIACENSKHLGYTTEKILHSFASRTIPIYWGDPGIKETFNPKAFINVVDYKNDEEFIERIKQIDNDDELYISILKEPALKNMNEFEDTIVELDSFIRNIFDNYSIKDYRRNMIMYSSEIQDNYKLIFDIYSKRYLMTFLRNFFQRKRRK